MQFTMSLVQCARSKSTYICIWQWLYWSKKHKSAHIYKICAVFKCNIIIIRDFACIWFLRKSINIVYGRCNYLKNFCFFYYYFNIAKSITVARERNTQFSSNICRWKKNVIICQNHKWLCKDVLNPQYSLFIKSPDTNFI